MEQLVGLLTLNQKEELMGILFTDDSYFNPVQDANFNWVISQQCMVFTTNPDYQWVKNLPLIIWDDPNPLTGSTMN
jgi:hypothetical protein